MTIHLTHQSAKIIFDRTMDVKKLYHELLYTSILLNIFDSLLTGMAFFSITYFLTYFYRINYVFSIVIGASIFLFTLYTKVKENKILIIEKKYPDLKEKLRTSFDYKDRSNFVLNNLHLDIMKKMKSVDVNAYLDSKKLTIKIFVICFMFLSTFYLSSVGFDFSDITRGVRNSAIYKKITDRAKDFLDIREEVVDRPLLDEPHLVNIGENEINISIDVFNTELDTNEIEEGEKNDFGGHFPSEVGGAAEAVYQDNIPEEHKDIIKKYFKKINE